MAGNNLCFNERGSKVFIRYAKENKNRFRVTRVELKIIIKQFLQFGGARQT
jgi:hypothetical protein